MHYSCRQFYLIVRATYAGPNYASRPLLRCRPRAQYEVHELPLFVEKSRSCRVVQERALVQHEQVASKKNSLHEHTRALYVIATRRLFYAELNAMSLGWRCDENQLNIFFQMTYFLRRHPSPQRALGCGVG